MLRSSAYKFAVYQELVLVVNQRNELVLQRDEEERMIENDEQIEQDITIPDEQLVRGKTSRDECRMQWLCHVLSPCSGYFSAIIFLEKLQMKALTNTFLYLL